MRIGHGYDVHKIKKEGPMTLGGIKIDCGFGLLAHSDGDVLAHAIMDALLGAAGLPDIGRLFPDNDDTYLGISSMELLVRVTEKIQEAGLQIGYIDSTIIAQRPKLAGLIPTMRETIAKYAGIEPNLINIKATTEEGLGFTGTMEGIAAHAVCLLSDHPTK